MEYKETQNRYFISKMNMKRIFKTTKEFGVDAVK